MRSPLLLAALALVAAAGPEADWQLRLPLTPAPGAVVQRVELPASAILASRRADGGDVRVLDADGRAQPIARLPTPAAPARRQALAPVPILGAADALNVTGVTLKVDDGQARVVRVDGAPAGTGQALLGVLLDTRTVDAPAHALTLDVTAPANQPITMALEWSADLRDWTPQAEKVLFRTGPTVPFVIPLNDREVAGGMLRLTWRAQGRLLSPVSVTRATLELAGSADRARLPVRATLPAMRDRRNAEFALPFAASPAALRVEPVDGGIPTSFQLFGRDDREQPWTEIGGGVATPLTSGGPQPVEIDRAYREWQIKAGANEEGFATPPVVEFRFAPVAIAFVAAGRPPYTLAVGRPDVGASFLPIATLDRMGGAGGPLPTATVAAGPTASIALPALASGTSRKTWLLWGVLLLGVAALGAMAWTLARPKHAP